MRFTATARPSAVNAQPWAAWGRPPGGHPRQAGNPRHHARPSRLTRQLMPPASEPANAPQAARARRHRCGQHKSAKTVRATARPPVPRPLDLSGDRAVAAADGTARHGVGCRRSFRWPGLSVLSQARKSAAHGAHVAFVPDVGPEAPRFAVSAVQSEITAAPPPRVSRCLGALPVRLPARVLDQALDVAAVEVSAGALRT